MISIDCFLYSSFDSSKFLTNEKPQEFDTKDSDNTNQPQLSPKSSFSFKNIRDLFRLRKTKANSEVLINSAKLMALSQIGVRVNEAVIISLLAITPNFESFSNFELIFSNIIFWLLANTINFLEQFFLLIELEYSNQIGATIFFKILEMEIYKAIFWDKFFATILSLQYQFTAIITTAGVFHKNPLEVMVLWQGMNALRSIIEATIIAGWRILPLSW